MKNSKNIELLSPSGDTDCLKAAVLYGADAVYLGSDIFGMRVSMRKRDRNFGGDKLKTATDYAHSHGVKVYLTCNTTPTNAEADLFPEFIAEAVGSGVDAAIVADFGILAMVKKYAPTLPVHMSTQVGVTNYAAAAALYDLGAARVVLARELSIADIAEIRAKTPKGLELESFVHGAMCVSYSGRCLLSAYMKGRHANRGECFQPCRLSYNVTENADGYVLNADDNGSFILNANDLNMSEHIPELINAGVTSLKIEGRAKTAYYTGAVTRGYRYALDNALNGTDIDTDYLRRELNGVSHRPYSTGFYYG
ncbi:MAG: U32 family peptidase, partial [Oscillospiraceae bacterium]|nr:U32 family peptidase [Oscillospiraceae bacterium]